jgi:hypothetical protein
LRMRRAWRIPKVTLMEDRMNRPEGDTTGFMLSGVLESYGVGFGGWPQRNVVYVQRRVHMARESVLKLGRAISNLFTEEFEGFDAKDVYEKKCLG